MVFLLVSWCFWARLRTSEVGACPHFAHTCARQVLIEADRDGVQIVVEQVGVDVERHRCGGVAEHPLDCLHVGAGPDRKARGGVPEVVQRQRGDAGLKDRVPEPALSRPMDATEVASVEAGEQEVVLSLVSASASNCGGEGCRERDGSLLVGLRCPDVDSVTDLHCVLTDVEPSTRRVHILHAQAGGLAPSEAAVRQHEDEWPKVAGGDGQLADLLVREIGVRFLPLAGHLHAARRVGEDPSVANGDVEDCGEHAVSTDDDGGASPFAHLGDPGAYVAVSDIRYGGPPPPRLDLQAPGDLEHPQRRRLEVRLLCQPCRAQRADRLARLSRIDELAAGHRHLHRGSEQLGLSLRPEATFVRL